MNFLGIEINKNSSPIICAELSCNHNGSIENAIKLITAAKEATANVVKVQLYSPDDMTIDCRSSNQFYINDGQWSDQYLYELYSETQTPYEFVKSLFEYAKLINIPIFASVFSKKGIDYLETLGCEAYKIASFEIVDLELVKYAARTNKPLVLSTGMASDNEIEDAYHHTNRQNTVLMHCISSYPTQIEECNLWKVPHFKYRFDAPVVGFSDHTVGTQAAPLAVALGARMIEKHLALDMSQGSQDEHFSAGPIQFRLMADACRRAFQATQKCDVPGEASSRQFRRSLYVVKDVACGQKFTSDNVRSIRPSYGLHPSKYQDVINDHYAAEDIKAGTALTEDHFK